MEASAGARSDAAAVIINANLCNITVQLAGSFAEEGKNVNRKLGENSLRGGSKNKIYNLQIFIFRLGTSCIRSDQPKEEET